VTVLPSSPMYSATLSSNRILPRLKTT
jgi:hypothetical protein